MKRTPPLAAERPSYSLVTAGLAWDQAGPLLLCHQSLASSHTILMRAWAAPLRIGGTHHHRREGPLRSDGMISLLGMPDAVCQHRGDYPSRGYGQGFHAEALIIFQRSELRRLAPS